MRGSVSDFKHLAQFGLQHESAYSDPTGLGQTGVKMDLRPLMAKMVQQKALERKALNTETGGAGTVGFATIPIFVDPLIVDQSRKFTPLQEIIQKVANQGTTADFNVVTAKGSAQFLAEDASLADQNDTLSRTSVAIKYAYSVGRVTGPSQAAMPAYMFDSAQSAGAGFPDGGFAAGAAPTANQLEVLIKARALAEVWEEKLVNGSTSSDANEFQGIVQTQSTTNKKDLDTTALTQEDVKDAIQLAFDDGGHPTLGICDSDTYGDLQLIYEDHARAGATVDIFGTQFFAIDTMVGRIPIIPSMNLSTTSGSKALYFLDLQVWEQRMLLDTTFERLAKTNDSDKFMLKKYGTLICRATNRNSWIGEIA